MNCSAHYCGTQDKSGFPTVILTTRAITGPHPEVITLACIESATSRGNNWPHTYYCLSWTTWSFILQVCSAFTYSPWLYIENLHTSQSSLIQFKPTPYSATFLRYPRQPSLSFLCMDFTHNTSFHSNISENRSMKHETMAKSTVDHLYLRFLPTGHLLNAINFRTQESQRERPVSVSTTSFYMHCRFSWRHLFLQTCGELCRICWLLQRNSFMGCHIMKKQDKESGRPTQWQIQGA